MSDLPFSCPKCGQRYGFGDAAALIGVVRSIPFTDTPTPCCGTLDSGTLTRRDDGAVVLQSDLLGEVLL